MRSSRNLLNLARLAFVRAARTQGSRAFAAGAARQASMNFGRTAVVAAGVAAGASYFLYEQQQLSAAPAKKDAPKIIIAGAPGSGKGTQCEYIVKKYGVVHISTGDILREQVKAGTALGKEAQEYMSKGALVPDSVVIGMVKAKLSEPEVKAKGWLLDGFPRTAAQAKAMADLGITADVFLQLEVPDSVLVERICLRRTDPVTGQIYHLKFNPPPAEVVSRLVHRSDDNESSLKERLKQYHANVSAIKNFYREISVTVDGEGPAGTAFKDNVSRVSRELFQGIDNQRYGSPKIIIAGAPGGGKGTQCEFIAKTYGVVHISTGDILREQVKAGTALGKEAKEYMSKGALVPDSVVIGMVKAKLSEPEVKAKGWLLDGFPRTAAQAKAMADIGIKADAFLQLEVPDSVLVERICLRRTDPVTGKIYHLKFNPPPADVVSRLVHRSDDNEESLRERLKQYHSNVEAIKKFYDDIKITVDGAGPASASFKDNVARVQKEIFKGIDDLKYGPGSSSRH